MLIPNQIIKQRWNGKSIKWYKDKGYIFTKRFDYFEVKAEDLTLHNSARVKVQCEICNKIYEKYYYSHIDSKKNGGDYCTKCKGNKTSKTTIDNHKDDIWERIIIASNTMGYKLISKKEDINGTKDKIKYECPKHGIKDSTINNYINLHGCFECGRELSYQKTRKSIDKIIEEINSVNGNILLNPEEYINAHTKNLIILCGCCGKNTFTTCRHNYRKQNRCMHCSHSMSINEKRIYDFLTSKNIQFIYQKRFPDCKDINILPFDFYIPLYNLCIEFDGEQHFNDHMYSTYKTLPYVNLEYVQKHDKIKTQYCTDNNINLLRITYKDENKIEKILESELIQLGIRYSLVS